MFYAGSGGTIIYCQIGLWYETRTLHLCNSILQKPMASAFLRAYMDLQVFRWTSQDRNSSRKCKAETMKPEFHDHGNLLCGVGLSPLVWIHNLQLSPEKRSQPSPPWSTSVAAIFTYSTRNSSTASQTSPESSDSHISHHRYAVFRVRMLPITLY